MSEKVILTQNQVDKIKELYNRLEELNMTTDQFIDEHALGGGYEPLNDLGVTVSMLARYFYIGYEVEPEFKPNDYVIYADGKVGQYFPVPKGYAQQMPVRHATPEEIAEEKERRFWNKNGRDVWGLRKRDVLRSKNSGQIVEVEYVTNNEEDGHKVRAGLEAWKDIEVIKRNYDVLCFAEDRKDVKVND